MADRVPERLTRKLGLFSVTSIVVANMIGAGIFTTSGLLLQNLGHPGVMLLLWLVGGILAMCGALCYGELGAAFPRAGGEYYFLSRLYHPVPGFLSGWVSFFAGFSAPIAASAIGFAEYLSAALPGLPGGTGAKKLYAVLVVALFTLIHGRGLELGSRVQNYLTLLKVGLIVGLICCGFTLGDGSLAGLGEAPALPRGFAGYKTLGLSLMWIMFAFSGWNAAAYIGSEIKNPGKLLPRSLIYGAVLVTLLYLGLNLLYIYALEPGEMKGTIAVAALTVDKLFGGTFRGLLSLLVSFALFSSLSAFIILGPRVYYAMARDGLFFSFAGRVHPDYGVPTGSIVLQGAVAALMVWLGTFEQILTYMGFSLGIFPILSALGVFRLRRQGRSVYKMPGFPLVPVVFIAVSLSVLVLAFFQRPFESGAAIAVVLFGIPVYYLLPKRDAG